MVHTPNKASTDEPFPPPVWTAQLRKVWTPPDWPELGLYHITNVDDLNTWAGWMGHSGANYRHWALDIGLWSFLTFLDEGRYPHCTIHLKKLEYLFTEHPDDREARPIKYWRGPVMQGGTVGAAKRWLPSTLYDDVDSHFNRPIMFKGEAHVVMGAGHRDKDPLWTGEERLFNEWYQSVVIAGSQPVPLPKFGED